jgi:predicted RNase H-like HicB family nuclease
MTEFTVIIEHDPDNGSYGASNPDLPVDGVGKTPDEAVARFQNALNDYLAFLRERGQPIPELRHTVTTVRAADANGL